MHHGAWLRATRTQEKDSGVDHKELACYAGRLTPYVQDHLSHALKGLEELYMLLPSTVLEESEQREEWEELRDEFIERTRKALDHIGATLCSVGCTDEQLANAGRDHDNAEDQETEDQEGDNGEACDEDDETIAMPIPESPVVLSVVKKI